MFSAVIAGLSAAALVLACIALLALIVACAVSVARRR